MRHPLTSWAEHAPLLADLLTTAAARQRRRATLLSSTPIQYVQQPVMNCADDPLSRRPRFPLRQHVVDSLLPSIDAPVEQQGNSGFTGRLARACRRLRAAGYRHRWKRAWRKRAARRWARSTSLRSTVVDTSSTIQIEGRVGVGRRPIRIRSASSTSASSPSANRSLRASANLPMCTGCTCHRKRPKYAGAWVR
jgi:hypothetical protein